MDENNQNQQNEQEEVEVVDAVGDQLNGQANPNGEQTGGSKSGKPGSPGSGKPRREKPNSRGENSNGDDSGYEVRGTQKTHMSFASSVSDDGGQTAIDMKGEARSTVEEAYGRFYVTEADPTNIAFKDKGSLFVDAKKTLIAQLNEFNNPRKHTESCGEVKKIDKSNELIAIVTLPGDENSIEYAKNNKITSEGQIEEDETSQAPKFGQYLGHSIDIKGRKVTKVRLFDMTPKSDFSKITLSDDAYKYTSSNAYVRNRETQLGGRLIELFEDKEKKGLAQNPIVKSPNTHKILQTLSDINRNTTAIVERAFLTVFEFMSSLSQNRFVYGQDQNMELNHYLSFLAPILDMKKDEVKINTTSDLVNKRKLDFVKDNWEVWSKFDGAYCYPKTTIAFKKWMQDLLSYSKPSNDHRSVRSRCNLAFTTCMPYSDCTSINGVDGTPGVGGNNVIKFFSHRDGDIKEIAVVDPVFDGISDVLKTIKNKSHVWVDEKTTSTIPLTFDPALPTFAFLVIKAIPQIIEILKNMCHDLYIYINEGGSLVKSMVKYPASKFEAFLKEAGYHHANWGDVTSDIKVNVAYAQNWRMRYPETSILTNENTTDADSLYSYYPGLLSPYSIALSGDSYSFTGSLDFPSGRYTVKPNQFVAMLDPVIFVDNDKYSSGAAMTTIPKSVIGTNADMRILAHRVKLGSVTIADWLKARRMVGLIYSVPSGLVPYDPDRDVMSNGSWVNAQTDAKIKAVVAKTLTATDFSAWDESMTHGIQLSSYRMEFAIPLNDFMASHVYVCNKIHSNVELSKCVSFSFSRAGYVNKTITKALLDKYCTADGDKISTKLKPADFISFPFTWGEMTEYSLSEDTPSDANDAEAAKVNAFKAGTERWAYHAKLIQLYSNPYFGIREQTSLGEDAPIEIIPHQKLTNSVYYWYELSCEDALNAYVSRIDASTDMVECDLFTQP